MDVPDVRMNGRKSTVVTTTSLAELRESPAIWTAQHPVAIPDLSSLALPDAAIVYAEMGLKVLPLKGKKPITRHGCLNASGDPARIDRWWHRNPNANIGIAAGDSGLVIIDVDIDRGGNERLQDLIQTYGPGFMNTVAANTGGGGYHFYYRTNGVRVPTKINGLGLGVDVISSGLYIVAPPSKHPHKGVRYVYRAGYGLTEREIEPAPDWLIERMLEEEQRRITRMATSRKMSEVVSVEIMPDIDLNAIVKEHGKLEKEHIRLVAANENFVMAVCRLMHIPIKNYRQPFKCILPGEEHMDSEPSATLYRGDNNIFMYRDWHTDVERPYYTLPEVYRAYMTGEVVHLDYQKPEHVTWMLRLLVDTGYVSPAYVPMPPLPTDASSTVKRVYDGFKLLLGCKWLYGPGESTAFSWRFAESWCGVSERHCGTALRKLMKAEVIVQPEKHGGVLLYRPGTSGEQAAE